jgi:hypothetical protein
MGHAHEYGAYVISLGR